MSGRQAVTPNDTDGAHYVPTAEVALHAFEESCACGPTPVLIETTDGDAWMYVHHSLERRDGIDA